MPDFDNEVFPVVFASIMARQLEEEAGGKGRGCCFAMELSFPAEKFLRPDFRQDFSFTRIFQDGLMF